MPVIDAIETGNNIKMLRDSAGLKNNDIANALGFTTNNAIYKWLNGESLPSLDNIVVLAKILNVKIDDILIVKTY